MVNNFKNIKNSKFFKDFVELSNNMDVFLTILIMKRRKDNPEMKKDVSIVRQFTVCNEKEYDDLQPKIIDLCQANNARAYLSVNVRDSREILLNMATKCIEKYKEKGSSIAPWNIFWEVAGQSGIVKGHKRWVIDVDDYDINNYMDHPIYIIIRDIICITQSIDTFNKSFDVIPSRTGFHIIVSPFDIAKFQKDINGYIGKNYQLLTDYRNVKDFIKKDNLTILYIAY